MFGLVFFLNSYNSKLKKNELERWKLRTTFWSFQVMKIEIWWHTYKSKQLYGTRNHDLSPSSHTTTVTLLPIVPSSHFTFFFGQNLATKLVVA